MALTEVPVHVISARSESMAWTGNARCRGLDQDIFYLPKGEGRSNVGHDAKIICGACASNKHCLTFAVDRREEFGIWGGCGEKTRRALERLWDQKECDGFGWAWSDINCECEWCEALDAAVDPLNTRVFDSNGDGATHGIRSTYARGCRCPACSLDAAVYSLEQRSAA